MQTSYAFLPWMQETSSDRCENVRLPGPEDLETNCSCDLQLRRKGVGAWVQTAAFCEGDWLGFKVSRPDCWSRLHLSLAVGPWEDSFASWASVYLSVKWI